MGKALLVVNMQDAYMGKYRDPDLFNYDAAGLLQGINEKIATYPSNHVFYILNLTAENFMSRFAAAPVYEGTKQAELVEGLSVVSNLQFKKFEGNAFSNESLAGVLKGKGVQILEIVGVDGAGCVAQTAMGAAELGFTVLLPTSCIGTANEKKAERLKKKMKSLGVRFVS